MKSSISTDIASVQSVSAVPSMLTGTALLRHMGLYEKRSPWSNGSRAAAGASPAWSTLFLPVTNGGALMAPATLAALFQPFWRGDNSGASGGLGLGLYIVNEIARSHHGAMEVTSTADATTFSFRMPAALPATAR
ncbi:ATP-binding protein [Massilia sp. TWR1-2-2]|uniref:ATP-binding protein n=1 Tax=Massilia sp. TWR1-2-2 TaxID=2804584 RepID=UPI003CF0DAFB